MKKFSEIEYVRPDMEAEQEKVRAYTKALKEAKSYEELYHEIIKAMVLEFRALKLKVIKPVSSTDKSGYNFSSTERSILNGINNYINCNQNV